MRILTYIFCFLFTFSISQTTFSQTPLNTAVDFMATDINGEQHHLFHYLDSGKYVVIYFFSVNCTQCQTYAPQTNASYEYFGCNNGDVVFLAIDIFDNDLEVSAFSTYYGLDYPAVSGMEGGGNAICYAYYINWFPTTILIAPDHTIVNQDIWYPTTQAINNNLLYYNCEPMACNSAYSQANFEIFELPGQVGETVIGDSTIFLEMQPGIDLSGLVPVFELSEGAQAFVDGELQVSGESVVDFSNGSVNYLITAANGMTSQTWQVTIVTTQTGINTYDNSIRVFPNPANDFIRVSNQQPAVISIFNLFGECIYRQQHERLPTIETAAFEPGTYLMRITIGEQTILKRFIITK